MNEIKVEELREFLSKPILFGQSLNDFVAFARKLAQAELDRRAALSAPVQRCMPIPMADDLIAALRRFAETVEDDGSFDISKFFLHRLVDIGAIRHVSGGRYQTTEFGDYVLTLPPTPAEGEKM